MRLQAVDIFCGAGGLTYGLRLAGITVKAGIDLDPKCAYPLERNNPGTRFICADIAKLHPREITRHWPKRAIRILAGCAPCQPFSSYTRGRYETSDEWSLLKHFGRLVEGTKPDIVTMENVPSLQSHDVYREFLDVLRNMHYCVTASVADCREFGVPQHRRRLVLLASRFGPISLRDPTRLPEEYATVRDAISRMPRVSAGKQHKLDRLHRARALSEQNLLRMRAARPGGTWQEWPRELRAPCHRRHTGVSYKNVYARMKWDEPAPTITTLAHSFGSGRFGHPTQDRALTLREAALLQSFPQRYRFVAPGEDVAMQSVGRLIGNAVPVKLARAIGSSIVSHAKKHDVTE